MTLLSDAPLEYRAEAERLAKGGDPLRADDLATEGLVRWPGDVRLRQIPGIIEAVT